MSDSIDASVIFGATGDLAKLETFPALVGLVEAVSLLPGRDTWYDPAS
jgi:glucose-6-phosphate 1-dehydrogenase